MRIESTTVFVNPFAEVDEMLRRERCGEASASASASSGRSGHSASKRVGQSSPSSSAIDSKRSRPDTASASLSLTASILESAARAADQRSAAAADARRGTGSGVAQTASSKLISRGAGVPSHLRTTGEIPGAGGKGGRPAAETSGGSPRATPGGTKLVRASTSDVTIQKPNLSSSRTDSCKLTDSPSTVGKYLRL